LSAAPLYRSAAISPIAQPPFLNTVVAARSDLSPRELLALAKRLELEAGRVPGPRWGPRPLDVDLLLVGARQMGDPDLELPHPRLAERPFVLAPLADLLPGLTLPPEGRTAHELLGRLPADPSLCRVPWTAADVA
jgi:2-amino-4-hydroxy-6-hydroxymethyldihydropteridine diphosphokinase